MARQLGNLFASGLDACRIRSQGGGMGADLTRDVGDHRRGGQLADVEHGLGWRIAQSSRT
jgi:hypothetical protein